MCCFSQPVISVNSTKIFARPAVNERQYIVYSMALEAKNELAMILPLPIKQGGAEPDFDFINLRDYANFFDDLLLGFPERPTVSDRSASNDNIPASAGILVVYQVGDFEASFVPTLKDFSRLDPRFRILPSSWAKLPQYKTYGFAVFKLKAGAHTVHPMAFAFARRDPTKLFFPTVHIHDGKVHSEADFDHLLYAQPRLPEVLEFQGWRESESPAKNFVKIDKARGIISGDDHCYQKILKGHLPNKDTWLASV